MYMCSMFSRVLGLVSFEMLNIISAPHLPLAQGCYTDQDNLFCPSSHTVAGPAFEGQEAGFKLILFHLLIFFLLGNCCFALCPSSVHIGNRFYSCIISGVCWHTEQWIKLCGWSSFYSWLFICLSLGNQCNHPGESWIGCAFASPPLFIICYINVAWHWFNLRYNAGL